MKSSALISEDDLLLKSSIEAGASQEALAKGNKKILGKRKGGNICIQYYRTRRRMKSESFNFPDLSFFDRCNYFQGTLNHEAQIGDSMFSDWLAKNLGSFATTDLVDKSADKCHESVQNDCINGSIREDGLYKLTENVCHLLTDNLMNFFDPGIEPEDDTRMHEGDSDNSSAVTEVEYASLPDSLLSFSDKNYIVCILNTEDTIDNIPNSQLLDHSPENVLENPSFHGDEQDVCHCKDDVESTSISHLDSVQFSEGETICILNTEDPEIPCNDNIFLLTHSSPSVRPQTATDFIDPASSFTPSQMDGPDLSSEFDSANQHVGITLKSVSLDHNPSISDHNNPASDCDLPRFPDIENPVTPCHDSMFLPTHPSPSVRPQIATDSIDPVSSFTQSQMDDLDLSSEFDSANPHVSNALKSASMDHNPSVSDHNNPDSSLPCFPDIENPEITCNDNIFLLIHPSSVRPQTATDSIDPASSFTWSQMDGPDFSLEFDSAHPHVDMTLKSVSMDHNPSISDHNCDNDLPCFPDIEDPEISSPSVRPQTATDSIDPASSFTWSQMDGPDFSLEFDSAHTHVGSTPDSLSLDHNPSISDHNCESDLHCFPDIEDPVISSPSVRSQTATDSFDPTSSFNQSQMVGSHLTSEFDSAIPHVGNTSKSVSMDHNPSISQYNCDSDLPWFPDIEDPEIPSLSVRPQTATDSIDPTASFTPSQMDGPDLTSEFDSAHTHVGSTPDSLSLDHNPSISDHNNSDSDGDLPCFPDIEALILKLDFDYAQESWITNDVKRRKYKHPKRTIKSLEQSSSQRAMSYLGAFAVFYSHHFNYYIKKTEVTIGRSTDDTEVDIDLRKESHSNMISRQQAIIKMETNGTFTLKNIGKGSVLVKGKSIARGQVAALGSSCLIQIRGTDFMFEVNDRYVRWYLDNIIKKPQGKFNTFEWSVG
ncbi:hypothetical protein L1987_66330 [Smallanthus sonchifolius]|uniref:Uncharacterized protein n=1 Tax=Smallanthus sonchifolius TaxID=185202 RepID=A0ACB9BX10_9ASTR|nr:hypothetical protein L1987_66330 [Smallanthus sonchifolius]